MSESTGLEIFAGLKSMTEHVGMMCLWMKHEIYGWICWHDDVSMDETLCEMLEIVERMLCCSYSLIGILCLYDSCHVTHTGWN